ncbi:MAG TPA: HAMP domain-containing sensor histidine kinase, partial [Gemmataceae bacterium]|nr:HAMP domain-containing sensor histidine kinase [Gemmataceae bacterium]
TELPDWLLLHFQIDNDGHWASPQVLGPALRQRLTAPGLDVPLDNATPQRERLLAELKQQLAPPTLLAQVRRRSEWLEQVDNTLALANPNFDPGNNLAQAAQPPAQAAVQAQVPPPQADQSVYPNANWNQNAGGYQTRNDQRFRVQQENRGPRQQIDASVFENNIMHNGSLWFAPGKGRPSGRLAAVSRRPMVPLWLPAVNGRELLVVARLVEVGDRQLVQGVVLDWTHLQKVLAAEVAELFPDARFLPMRDPEPPHPERTMTHLPVEMDPGIEAPPLADAGWTPLRIGLALAWAAALVALCAVGLGSWGLLDLSERRFRFVSAVTHELRTPLTTLRLYLDMLTGGMVREEAQRAEYLHTLRAEADRLHRLVANVLDFSRLENQRPRLVVSRVTPADLLEKARATWRQRCQDAGKELVVVNEAGDAALATDAELAQQVLGNLIDNACKYSQGAEERRIWLRARRDGKWLVLEVEDGGPGVPAGERRAIFRAFRRGRGADATGGVGLGLALARRWARLLGGRLTLRGGLGGACFLFELPLHGGDEPRRSP